MTKNETVIAPVEGDVAPSAEELCGSTGRVDTVHLTNLVADFSKLYGTTVTTKVAYEGKVAAEKRLIQAIRANLDRYDG